MNTSNYDKFGLPCQTCRTKYNLTKHHVKNLNGNKTGDIRILCRSCHDVVEKEYALNGMIKPQPDTKRLTSKKHIDTYDLTILTPFHSTGKKDDSRNIVPTNGKG